MKDYVWLGFGMVFYPGQTLGVIKRNRNSLSYLYVLVMLAALATVYLAKLQLTHFPLSTVNLRTSNLLTEISIPLIPLIAWIIAGYAVTTIKEGSAKFLEFSVTVVCCTVPYLLLGVPLALVSYLFESDQASLFQTMNTLLLVWVLVLMFYSFMQINDYSLARAVTTGLVGIVAMLAMLFVAFILYSMTMQFMQFLRQVILEIQLIRLS